MPEKSLGYFFKLTEDLTNIYSEIIARKDEVYELLDAYPGDIWVFKCDGKRRCANLRVLREAGLTMVDKPEVAA